MRIQAVAFDLEGTCVDLEEVHFQAYEKACADLGIEKTASEIAALPGAVGGGAENIAVALKKLYPNVDVSRISALKWRYFDELIAAHDMHPREGLMETMELLRSRGTPVSVGSLTDRAYGEMILSRSGLGAYFPPECLVFKEDVEHIKPAPDVYLKTAARMNVAPEDQLVFEDSIRGVEAGRAAGSVVIGVPSSYMPEAYAEALTRAGASAVYSSWSEVLKYVAA